MRPRTLPLLILLTLTGCAPNVKPIVPPKVVTIVVPEPVPVDLRLTEPCDIVMPRSRTVEEAVFVARARRASLEACNARMREIRDTH